MKRIVLACAVYSAVFSCTPKVEEQVPVETSNLSGEELVNLHCASCHVRPKAEDLPKEIWMKSVLPKMAYMLGVKESFDELINLGEEERTYLVSQRLYPERPLIHIKDWEKIEKYFYTHSPDSLILHKEEIRENTLFKPEKYSFEADEIVFAKSVNKQILVGSATKRTLEIASLPAAKLMNGTIVDYKAHPKHGEVFLDIGNMNPNDLALGKLKTKEKVLIDDLKRPVSMEIFDANEDGVQDFFICSFGNYYGDLSWYDGVTFEKNILLNSPGARNVQIVDYDKDGKKDILVLMTQAKEAVWLFLNKGKGEFEPKQLITFPSYYGSGYFEVVDMNNDGRLDIVLCNGDNADLSKVLKPYHGIRVFYQKKDGKLVLGFFHNVVGLTNFKTDDFDLDGDMDIIGASFFPDFVRGKSVVFFENNKKGFTASDIKEVANTKWLTIEKADIDQDGDQDVILGAFNRENLNNKQALKGVYILKNKTK